jgi:hypothetical protein
MRACVPLAFALAVSLIACLAGGGTARGAWRPPVRGPVVRGYDHVRFSFARGEVRGARFAAAAGAPVRAACGGRVTWAGSVAAAGPGLAVRCGRLSMTLTGLGTVAVRRGRGVAAGAVVGTAGARGWVQLGARRVGVRDGYLDPLGLIGTTRAPRPPAGWRRRAPRARGPVLVRPAPVAARPAPSPAPATWPLALGGALALVCAGVGLARRGYSAGAKRLRPDLRKLPSATPARSARE